MTVLSQKVDILLIEDEEFDQVYRHARDLGFRHLFVQFPDPGRHFPQASRSPFLPDFEKAQPFGR